MSKITLSNPTNFVNDAAATATIAANNATVTSAFDNTVSRDGSSPNQMNADFDMNSHHILNLPKPSTPTDAVRLEDLQGFFTGGNVPFGGNAGAVLAKNTNLDLDYGWTNAITHTTISGLTVSTTTGTFTLSNIKTFSVTNSLTLSGTDGTTMTFPGTSDTVVTLAATQTLTNKTLTAPVIATIINTGTLTLPTSTDTLVGRATTDTLTNKTIDTAGPNTVKINGTSLTAVTGSGSVVLATSPILVTPNLGVATATSVNGLTISTTTGTLSIANGKTLTVSNSLTLAGTDSTTITFQGTDTYVGRATTDTLTNKTLNSPSIDSATLTTVVADAGALRLTGIISPASLSTNTNNWNPAGVSTATVIRAQCSPAVNVTGLVSAYTGQVLTIMNIGASTITLTNLDASSTAANQFNLGANTALGAGQSIAIWYDGTSSVWRPVAGAGSGGGGGGVTSIAGNTGAFTLSTGLTNSTNDIQFDGNFVGWVMPNIGLTASVGSNILTVNLTTATGGTPSATSPVMLNFRSATAATGTTTALKVTSALSITTNAVGASLGSANTIPFRLWVVIFNNGGTPVLALWQSVTTPGAGTAQLNSLMDDGLATTTAMSASATSANTFYTPNGTTIASASAYRILGYVEYGSGLTTAGTYASGPTKLQVYGPGIKLPGDFVQSRFGQGATTFATASTTFQNSNNQLAISPSSAPNVVKVTARSEIRASTSGLGVLTQLYRGTAGTVSISAQSYNRQDAAVANVWWDMNQFGWDIPGTTSSTTYVLRGRAETASVTLSIPDSALGASTGNYYQMELVEYMA